MQNIFLDCRKAGKTDNLSDSLNYGEVSHFITDFLQDHTYKLIESCRRAVSGSDASFYAGVKRSRD